jgi:anti-anti-sigma factor
MTTKRSNGAGRRAEATNVPGTDAQELQCGVIDVERSGDWMPAEELKESAMIALAVSNNMTVNLNRIDYLDASAMQILLAIETEQQNSGQHLHLVNASPRLLEWFELSGAAGHFFGDQRNTDE